MNGVPDRGDDGDNGMVLIGAGDAGGERIRDADTHGAGDKAADMRTGDDIVVAGEIVSMRRSDVASGGSGA